jgi:hypothetical protein
MTGPLGLAMRTTRVELMEQNDMNELNKPNTDPGFFQSIAKDEGVQRSVAGVAVGVVVAVVKHAVFGAAS